MLTRILNWLRETWRDLCRDEPMTEEAKKDVPFHHEPW